MDEPLMGGTHEPLPEKQVIKRTKMTMEEVKSKIKEP